METFTALLLDERDILRAVEQLTEDQLTARHVDMRPHGNACDRKPGEYRWDRTSCSLRPLARTQRAVQGRPSIEQAIAFDYLGRWKVDPLSVPEVCLCWLDEMAKSVDMRGYVVAGHPDLVAYDRARALNIFKGA